MMEFVKGHLSFPGTASRNGKWTAEDDRLAQFMEAFGPFPKALLRRGVRSGDFLDSEGMQCSLFFNVLHVTLVSYFTAISSLK